MVNLFRQRHYWVKRQLLGRFRISTDNIYELRKDRPESEIDFNVLSNYIQNETSRLEREIPLILEGYDNELSINEGLSIIDYLNSIKGKAEHLYYSQMQKKIRISEDSIRNKLINMLNSKLEQSMKYTEQFYVELANCRVKIVDYEDLVSNEIDLKEFQELIGDIIETKISEDPLILMRYFTELFTAYCSGLDVSKIMNKKILEVLDNTLLKDSYKAKMYSFCFVDRKSMSYMEEAYNLIMDGYPAELVVKILLLKKKGSRPYNTFMRKLDFLSGLKIARKLDVQIDVLKHRSLYEDYFFPAKFHAYYSKKQRLTKEDIEESVDLWKGYSEPTDRKFNFIEYLNSLFITKRNKINGIGGYDIVGDQTLTKLLQSEGIQLSVSTSIILAQMPYVRLIRKLDEVLSYELLPGESPLFNLRNKVRELSSYEQTLQDSRVPSRNVASAGGLGEIEVSVMYLPRSELRKLPGPEEP